MAVVNDALATRYWPDSDAVGKRLRLRPLDPWLTVVGVVGNVRRFARDDEIRSEFYLPLAQSPSLEPADRARIGRHLETPGVRNLIQVLARTNLVVFTDMPTEEFSRAVRAALPSGVSVTRLTTLQGMLDEAAAPRRFILQTFGMFAIAAFVLAGLGIFSVMHYLVSSGGREMGIRLALGATRTRIFCMVISRSLALSVAGVAIGLTAAWAASRRIDPTLYRVTAQDPLTFGALAVALVLVATLAGWIPAHQATRVDPLRSLRDD